jgi:hypothetical protein
VIDDLFDEDPFDLDQPEEVVLAAGTGMLGAEDCCSCACACEREVEWPEDDCRPCREGRHWDLADPARDA